MIVTIDFGVVTVAVHDPLARVRAYQETHPQVQPPPKPKEAEHYQRTATAEQLRQEQLYMEAQASIPHGSIILGVTETQEGMTVSYVPPEHVSAYIESKKPQLPPPRPSQERVSMLPTIMKKTQPPTLEPEIPVPKKSIAEMLVEVTIPIYRPKTIMGVPMPFGREPVRPFAPVAGVIAPTESLVYTIGRLTGHETPSIPPTLSPESLKYGEEYVGGLTVGEILLGYGIGKAAEPFTTPITERVTAKAQEWLTKEYVEAMEKGAEWKGLPEKIVMKITGAKPYLAPGEVAIAPISPYGVGIKEIEATEAYWEMIQVPKTAGVMIGKPQIITKGLQTYIFEWTMVGKEFVPRFRPMRTEELAQVPAKEEISTLDLRSTTFERYPWRMGIDTSTYFEKATYPTIQELKERGLLPFVTQTQQTRMGIYPAITIPRVPEISISTEIFGFHTIGFLTPFLIAKRKEERISYPVIAPTPISKTVSEIIKPIKLKEPSIPKLEQPSIPKTEEIVVPKISPIEISKVSPIQELKTVQQQVQRQIQRTIQIQPTPTPLRQIQVPKWLDELPKQRRRKKGKAEPFGLYGRYPRRWPVATPKQVLKMAIGVDITKRKR